MVIQAIIQENSGHPEFGHIIDDIRILATDSIPFQVCHVKRNCNVVADALAKKVKDTLDLAVWLEGCIWWAAFGLDSQPKKKKKKRL